MKHGIDIGDMVKMKRGYSAPGLVIEISETNLGMWVCVLWPDHERPSVERHRDVEVVSEIR